MDEKQARQRIDKLINEINKLRYKYHVLDDPSVSDEIYDSLERELEILEKKYSRLKRKDSPLQRIGSKPLDKFKKVKHQVRQWSFNDAFEEKDVFEWEKRMLKLLEKELGNRPKLKYSAELKIDGLHVVLTYKKGYYELAATRGDGIIGEDVTQNVKTIKSIPLKINKEIGIVVEGEVWLSEKELVKINQRRKKEDKPEFANPRNAAAGTIRQLDSKVVARRNLDSFIYDISVIGGESLPKSQGQELEKLKDLGFKVNNNYILCKNIKQVIDFYNLWVDKKSKQDYWIDGIVIKINQKEYQDILGYVGKAPRWALAYKFPAEQATSIIKDIQVQVGRLGTLTPVAILEPLKLAGTTVKRATLHNQEQINKLGIKIGDTVVVQKAGDIIPEVTQVLKKLRTGKEKKYHMPKKCPICGSEVVKKKISEKKRAESADFYCSNLKCFSVQKNKIVHFVSKKAFNIDGLGDKIIEQLLNEGLIKNASNIFELTEESLKPLERFAEKSAANTIKAIQTSKKIDLNKFIYALGISGVGEETAINLAEYFGDFQKIKNASMEKLSSIMDIGPVVAENIYKFFRNENYIRLINNLFKNGINLINPNKVQINKLNNKTFVLTGSLKILTRDQAKDKIRKIGGKVSSSVSTKTDYVIAGKDPGSKYDKARELDIKILNEEEFVKLIK